MEIVIAITTIDTHLKIGKSLYLMLQSCAAEQSVYDALFGEHQLQCPSKSYATEPYYFQPTLQSRQDCPSTSHELEGSWWWIRDFQRGSPMFQHIG